MSDRGLSQLLTILRRRATPKSDFIADGDLLARYVVSRDEAAFELLVRRHGAMVVGVAHRVLRESHAAEDVFQAAFLTLAKKAKSLRRYESLASWLYRVTLRIALRSKNSSFSVRRIPAIALPEPIAPANHSTEWAELRSILDEEINELPERFRSAIVLCYFSGKTTEEASQILRCPRGTVLSRLAAGRERLRTVLTRRGYVVSTALITAGLTSETAPAGLSATLVALAMKVIGSATAVTPAVASLSYGVMHAMLITKMKIAAGLLLAVGGLGFGVSQIGAGQDEPRKPLSRTQEPEQDEERRIRNNDERARVQELEKRRRLLDERMELEKRTMELLKVASKQRIELKSKKFDIEDKIEELRQEMVPTNKILETYLMHQVEATLKIQGARISGVKDEEIKRQMEANEQLTQLLDELKHKLQKNRAEIRNLRRHLLEVEEELSLQESASRLQIDRIQMGGR